MTNIELESYLEATVIINWRNPGVLALAKRLRCSSGNAVETARQCFEWVRDEILHSWDHKRNPVTCSASEVLEAGTGFCYAKSHLLAALLRANRIPAGFCYQRLSRDGNGAPYCLHGLNAVFLPEVGWYRVDARGNKAGVDARFTPPVERLAYATRDKLEADLPEILPAPLPIVERALRRHRSVTELWEKLPDLPPPEAEPNCSIQNAHAGNRDS